MASGKPTRKGARILCADSEREGLLCADSAGEGLDDGRNPLLGWRGRKRAALLPARSETHGQSAPRRPGSSLPVRATIRCPPWFSRQGQLGAPPPLHRSRSDGIERGRGSVSSRLEKGCRPAIPHGSFPLSAPKVRMRCRRARVSGEGGASLPAHARQKRSPLALPIAARLRVSHRDRADTPWPLLSNPPPLPPLAASPLLLARLFSLRTLSNLRFFLRMIDSGANGFDLCACTNRAKRRHETSCPMAG